MMDLVTVGLRVTDDGTAAVTKFGTAAELTAAQVDRLEASRRRLNSGGLAAKLERDAQAAIAWNRQMTNALGGLSDSEYFATKMAMGEADAHRTAAVAGESHRLATGKVTRALEGLVVSSVGANAHISALSVALADFGLGAASTMGVLLGIAAISTAYDKLTESAHAAEKAQNDGAKNALDALRAHVAGPGGATGDDVTGALGQIEDLKQLRKERASFLESLKNGSALSFNLSPSDRADQLHNFDSQIGQLQAAVKWGEARIATATAKDFAASVTSQVDYAMQRGQSLDGFYTKALASEKQLTLLAKSGTAEVRDLAIGALSEVERRLDHFRLKALGLAESPSRVLGLPSDVAIGAMRDTTGNLTGAIGIAAKHGTDISTFGQQILDLADTIDRAAKHAGNAPTSVRAAIQQAVDDAGILQDALRLAGAKDKSGVAADIRNAQHNDGFLSAAQAETQYGQQLAAREAALRLPPAFDAAREAALGLGEGLRTAHQNLLKTIELFKPKNIGQGAQAGAEGAINDALMNFTPQALAYQAVSAGINYIVSGFEDMAVSMFDGGASAREAARAFRQATDEYLASAAAFRHDDLGAALAQDAAAFEQLIKQTTDTLGDVFTLVHGGRAAMDGFTNALADQAAQEARNQALIVKQAQENEQYRQEDLEVRNLRATGHGSEADTLAYKESQQREYTAAYDKVWADGIETAAEALYLNTLRTTQNNELIAFQNGLLTDALRNEPTGFRVDPYTYDFQTPRPSPTPVDLGVTRPQVAGGLAASGNTTTYHIEAINIDGTKSPKEVVNALINHLDQVAAATGGAGSSRARALELVTR